MSYDDDASLAAEQYWTAAQDLIAGRDAAAAAALRRLGLKYALAPGVWAACRGRRQQLAPPTGHPAPPPVVALDGALPGELTARLATAFAPGARYWRAHGYPEAPFFSYLIPLPAAALAAAAAAPPPIQPLPPPTDALRTAATLLALAGVEQTSVLAGATHVEVWAHTRAPWAPHQLHFDLDESRLRRGRAAYRLRHPVLSSVLFLSSCGGPTVVFDQTPLGPCAGGSGGSSGGSSSGGGARSSSGGGDGAVGSEWAPLDAEGARRLASQAWAVHPEIGRWAAWPGDLLHGVLPGELQPVFTESGGGAGGGEDSQAQPHRTTLVFAYWRGDPREEAGSGSGSGGGDDDGGEWPRPMLDLPACSEGTWMDDCALFGDGSSSGSSDATWWRRWQEHAVAAAKQPHAPVVVELIRPAFVTVGGGGTSDDAVATKRARGTAAAAEQELPPLRYFLRNADDIEKAYPQHT